MVDDVAGLSSEISAEIGEDIDYVFDHNALWETGGGLSFPGNDRSVITTAFQWF